MIQFIESKNIDKVKWNHCIGNSINSLLYAYSWYMDVVCEDWAALVENDYESVMPLAYRKKFGIHYIYPPIFIQQLGIFSMVLLDDEISDRFLKAIPKKFRFIEYNLNSYNQIDNKKHKIKNNVNHLLDLIINYEAIAKNYSENLKRNLKKANKTGVNISQNLKPEDIIEIFSKNKGKEINKFGINEYAILKKLTYIGIHKGYIQTYGAYTIQNELCAGAIFAVDKQRAIFLFSATNKVSKNLFAMPLLIDNFIKNNAEKNIVLDFEGSNDENLARFYKSFGSKTVNYNTLHINKLPFYIKIGVFFVKRIRNFVWLRNIN